MVNGPRKAKTAKPEWNKVWIRSLWISGIIVLIGLIIIYLVSKHLTPLKNIEKIEPSLATTLYSSDGVLIHELFIYNRLYVSYLQLPDHVIHALIATEDRSFYSHWGVNLKGIPRAILVNLKTMSFSQGFSTLTMQLARNIYQREIGFQKSLVRKLEEILTAIQLERNYSKQEILEMYLNFAYFGNGAYGIEAASHTYFGKSASQLTIEEGALLIALLKAPALYSPFKYPERALRRRNVVIRNMVEMGYLAGHTADSLSALPIVLKEEEVASKTAPYFTEQVRLQLNALQDSLGVNIYEGGFHVFTTLDTRLQWAMDSAVAIHYPRIQEEVRNDEKKNSLREQWGDSLFLEKTTLQIGFVALDPTTGQVLAMVGGADFGKYKYDHVFLAKRQPGSAFKPFVYLAAIDNGYLPTDKYLDQPIVIPNEDGTRWTPQNYDETVGGPMPLRVALRKSRNLPTIRLILDVGPQVVVNYARRLGISTPLSPYPALALGSSDVNPLEIINAYGVFANQGVLVKPILITRIQDRFGNIIYEKQPERKAVLNPATAFIITSLLQDVVNRGTGYTSRSVYRFLHPAAGKTGTTNDYTDAWFIGYTPHLVAGIWVGLDDHQIPLGKNQTGAHTALPFWADFMRMAYDTLKYESQEFLIPKGVVTRQICEQSFELATPRCPSVYTEYFLESHVPSKTCSIHGNTRQKERVLF